MLEDLNAHGSGFGTGSMNDVQMLSKALEAGYGTSPESQNNGGAFRVESLENSLKVLTYSEQHVQLWKRIPKAKATNTVEEYNQLLSYGSDGGGFILEGELPNSEDSIYQRQAAFVKFLGTTREVTHPMTLVNSAHGDVIARTNKDGMLWLLKKLEHGLFYGNSKLGIGGTESAEFDGLDNLIPQDQTLDVGGGTLEEHHINYGAQMILENYGIPTHIFMPLEVQAQFSQEFFPKERVIMPNNGQMQAGLVVEKFMTHGGAVEFVPDVFLKRTKPAHVVATSPKAPTKPTIGEVASGATVLNGELRAGTYKVAVALANRNGISALSDVKTVTVTEGQNGIEIPITINNGAFPAEHAVIYRSEPSGNQLFQVDRVPLNNATGSDTIVDKGIHMANTYTAFMGQLDESVLAFKQLAPMMKMDLATLAPSYRWMILLYGMPVLYAPRKFVRIKNIKCQMFNRDIM